MKNYITRQTVGQIESVGVHTHVFQPFIQRETTAVIFYLLPWINNSSKMGSALNGKNVHLEKEVP